MIGVLPLISFGITVLFTLLVFTRWSRGRHRTYLLVWSFGLVLFAVGNLTGALYSLFGWQDGWGELNFRIWYVSGAILVAAWLGQGTVFLLWRRLARPTLLVLAAGSIVAIVLLFRAPVDATPLMANLSEPTGKDVLPTGVRLIPIAFNVYGAGTLVVGALWSAFVLWRRRGPANRMIGNIIIAAGALAPAVGGTLSRFDLPGLYLGNLVGAALMLVGFLVITREARAPAPQPSAIRHQAA